MAVDAALGKGIGTAFNLIKDIKIGTTIIKETVELSNKVKQTLGKVKVPLSDVKVVSDTLGNKWIIRDAELKKLEDIIKPMESRAKETLSGVKKAVNLPAWDKLTFRVDPGETKPHFLTGHKTGGSRLTQSIEIGGKKTVFPEWMTEDQVINAIKTAYNNSKKVKTQQFQTGKVVTLVGDYEGMKIKIHLNLDLKEIESAYPILGGSK